jgi:hypothetical protein
MNVEKISVLKNASDPLREALSFCPKAHLFSSLHKKHTLFGQGDLLDPVTVTPLKGICLN